MNALRREDVVGRHIADIIISMPDKPVSMSDMSYSAGYLRLDSGILFDLGMKPLEVVNESTVLRVARDTAVEQEFRSLLGQEIEDVVLTADDWGLCVLTRDSVINVVPAQFWVRPFISKRTGFYETVPYWKSERIKLLPEAEFMVIASKPMKHLNLDVSPAFDFWHYFGFIPTSDFQGHDRSASDVSFVREDSAGGYQFVHVSTEDKNVFMVLVLDISAGTVLGHRLLDLNQENGLNSPGTGSG